jgi:nucleoside-diphosphate-sugar epimerase
MKDEKVFPTEVQQGSEILSREALLITGINGFVGRGLAAALQESDRLIKGTTRNTGSGFPYCGYWEKGDRRTEDGEREGAAFCERDVPEPQDSYAVSKYEAEQGLLAIAEETGMEVVIIRPPLVYGPGVKANFLRLIKLVKLGIPLPLGAVHNKRSFVALDNLVSFIILCMDHPRAANEVFLISDGEDVSTTELLQKMAQAFGKRSFLLPVPVGLMTFVAGLLGKKDVADRLFGSLQVDSSKARDLLGWEPVVSMDEGLRASRKGAKTLR